VSAERDRKTALLALAPLLVIAAGFVTPPILRTPYAAEIALWEDWTTELWPVHVTALVLAVIGAAAAWRRTTPGPIALGVALVGVAWCTAMLVWAIATMKLMEGYRLLSLTAIACVLGALALGGLALRRRGWARWTCVLGAYAIAVALYGCPLIPGMFNLFSGGLTFVLADATLIVLAGAAVARASRRAA
jgi:hypothetical protein